MKHLFRFTLFLLALLLPATAFAHDFEVDGIYYNINGTEATITHRGTDSWNHNTYSGSVTIPATVTYGGTTYSVTSIGDHALQNCSGLTSITIPNSVTSIGNYAFSGCIGLTSINIPNSVTSIGNYAFSGCSGLTNITIPNSVTAIGDLSFNGCSGLTSITIGNSVTFIGNYAFQSCIALTSVTIPNSVTTIGDGAFNVCRSLTSITIPNSVTSIGSYAFSGTAWYDNLPDGLVYAGLVAYKYKGTMPTGTSITLRNGTLGIAGSAFEGCSGLTSIDIPNSVTSIGEGAFSHCSGLTSIDIPNSVTTIGGWAFGDCSGLTSVVVASGNPAYDSRNNCNAIIETASNTLIAGCQNTNIPNSVTSIGEGAFACCNGLTNITIPNSVTSIGDGVFLDCTGLTSVTIPNSVTSIGNSAFENCSGLTSIAIGNSVTSIGYFAFSMESSSMTRVDITDLAAWCNIEFDSWDANPLTCCGHLYLNGSEITELNIPNSVNNIKNYAFSGCTGLTSITIPNSVTTIGSDAFYWCTSLTSVTIPNSITSIGDWAFSGCWNLTEIYCLAWIPPAISSYTFDEFVMRDHSTLYVYDISMESYQSADYWNEFANIVGIPYTFEVDGTSYHATTLNTASVMANENEGTLYSGDVAIPDSVTYEGYTFAVTGIESNAFDGCFELTSITIPNSVETIGEQAFQGCTGLTSVTIGSGVTAIGAKAFNYCNALETVKCMGTVPPVMASVDCFSTAAYNRATLLVPRNSEATYAAADYWYKFAHIDGWGSAGRGDVNGDGVMNIADVTFLIDAILRGDHEGIYFESADLNINGRLDIGDVTSLIDELLNSN